jgi:hypothetical protein
MSGRLSDTENLVIHGSYRFNRRRSEPQRGEALMRRAEVFHHYDSQSICVGFPLIGSYSKISPLLRDLPVSARINAQ